MDEKNVTTALDLGGISALAAACRTILSDEERTFKGFLVRTLLGIFAGMITGFAIQPYITNQSIQFAIVSAAALTAKEVILFIIACVTITATKLPQVISDKIAGWAGKK